MLNAEALGQSAFFVGIGSEFVAELWGRGRVAEYEAGARLFDRGDEARDVLVLESGSADLYFPVPVLGVTKEVTVERVGPGDVLAWSALVNPFQLTLSARCVEACVVRAFARDELRAHLRKHPEIGCLLMENLAGVVGRRLQHFQDLWIREVQSRIVGLLG